jgi:CRP-like cAMP-binding protein
MMRHRPDLSALAEIDLFAGYTPGDLAPLAPHVDRLVVMPGVTLAHEGRRPHEVVVVLSGDVVERRDGVDVGRRGAGAVIGAREELEGTAHEATLVAGSAVDAVVITGPAFRWAAQSLPGFTGPRDRAS